MKLRILAGPNMGKSLDLSDEPFIIGRDTECQLVLNLDGVSRRHARISAKHGVYVIEDLGSTNGVRVNGEKIAGEHSLLNGDRIGVGDAIMLFTDEHHIIADAELTMMDARSGPVQSANEEKSTPAWLPAALIAAAALVAIIGATIWLLSPTEPANQVTLNTSDDAPPPPVINRVRPITRPSDHTVARPVRNEPQPATDQPNAEILYFYVKSNPAGATIDFDGTRRGKTPLLLSDLEVGRHELKLTMPGFEPLELKLIYIPFQDVAPVYQLSQLPGTCLITSEPSDATVLQGGRILGQTPLVTTDLPPGNHGLVLDLPGYARKIVDIRIHEDRTSETQVTLESNLGAASIVTFPPGAQISIDGTYAGTTQVAAQQSFISSPLALDGLPEGEHQVTARLHNLEFPSQSLTIAAGKTAKLSLTTYLPNTVVKLNNGQDVVGMLRRRNKAGDMEMILDGGNKLMIKAVSIKSAQIVPYDEFIAQKLRGGDQ